MIEENNMMTNEEIKKRIDFISININRKARRQGFSQYYHMIEINFVKIILIQKEECEEILIISKNLKKIYNKILS